MFGAIIIFESHVTRHKISGILVADMLTLLILMWMNLVSLVVLELCKQEQGTRLQKSQHFNLALLSVFKLFSAFRFFLLLYLLVPTYTTFIRAPSYQNFHYLTFHLTTI